MPAYRPTFLLAEVAASAEATSAALVVNETSVGSGVAGELAVEVVLIGEGAGGATGDGLGFGELTAGGIVAAADGAGGGDCR